MARGCRCSTGCAIAATTGTSSLYAFDFLQVDNRDLRREPIEDRKAELAKLLRRAQSGLQLNEPISEAGDTVFRHACKLGLEASCRSVSARPKGPGAEAPAVKREAEDRRSLDEAVCAW